MPGTGEKGLTPVTKQRSYPDGFTFAKTESTNGRDAGFAPGGGNFREDFKPKGG